MKDFLKKYKRSFPIVMALLLFSGMGLIAWFGIRPFQGFVTEKADGIQEYYATRENREAQLKRLPDLQGQFENIKEKEGALAILLPEKNVVDFVQTLERLAKENGVWVEIRSKTGNIIEEKKAAKVPVKKTTVDTGGDSDGATPAKGTPSILDAVPFDRYLHVEVVVKGEYKTIVTFLHKMETLPIALDVIGMNMKMRDMEAEAALPNNPGRNPFLMFAQDGAASLASADEQPSSTEQIPGTLEASFDTLVYLDK